MGIFQLRNLLRRPADRLQRRAFSGCGGRKPDCKTAARTAFYLFLEAVGPFFAVYSPSNKKIC
jgi:hypothetical protein